MRLAPIKITIVGSESLLVRRHKSLARRVQNQDIDLPERFERFASTVSRRSPCIRLVSCVQLGMAHRANQAARATQSGTGSMLDAGKRISFFASARFLSGASLRCAVPHSPRPS
jgi:hypothetical protein